LLSGFRLPQAPEFEAWVELERAALAHRTRTLVLEASERSVRNGRSEQALGWLDAWLALDPLDEEAVRAVMLVGSATGVRSAAIARYEEFARRIADSVGGSPERQTRELAEALSAGQLTNAASVRLGTPARPKRATLRKPIVGRDAEVKALWKMLTEVEGPVVTLLGMGGMG